MELLEKNYGFILENLLEGIWVEDPKGEITFINSRIAEICNCKTPTDLIGKTRDQLLPEAEIKWIEEYLRQSKKPILTCETLLKTKKGLEPVRLHIILLKKDKEYLGRVCAVLSVVKERQLEQEVKTASSHWQELMENSIDGICILSGGSFEFVNRRFEEMTGYAEKELKQLRFEDVIAPKDLKNIEVMISMPERIILPVHYEVRLLSKLKREVDTELRVVPVESEPRGTLTAAKKTLLCFFRDITQIKELERTKTEFIAMVSHELRTPLATIKEAISLLSEVRANLGEVPSRFVGIAREEISRLERMMDNLLEVSRIESGKVKLRIELVRILPLIDQALESLTVFIDKKKINIVKNIAPDLPVIYGDSDRIFHLIVNLLDNAVKFTPSGGKVTIGVSVLDQKDPIIRARRLVPSEKYLMVTVVDSGPGIAPENLERIFEKFERGEPAAGARGIGLGLAIARNTVEAHKGKIWATSQSGKGSIFTFILPAGKIE